ncbi:MAG: anaerobic sulfatase maturase [Neisseria sp.]|nr:anaerobic sulfatase maturase [Neisseria sp.]
MKTFAVLPERPQLKLPPLGGGDFYAFHTMIKPVGAQCNIDCTYCFYLHKQGLLHQSKTPRMSERVLEEHIRQYLEANTGEEAVFTWQGGEPMLAGLDFYRKAVALQKKYARPGQRVLNDLQTNGLLLDDEWCVFLHEHRFLVGLSLDGPEHLHNRYRIAKNGKPTFPYVMRAVEKLKQYRIPFNILCVVNRANAEAPLEVYRFLRDTIAPRMIQFLPCAEAADFQTAPLPLYGRRAAAEWSVAPEQWGHFLCTVWQEWLAQDFGRVFVDQFENTVSQALGFGAQKCVTAPVCGKAAALEHNGDFFACDHFVYPEYRIGNIAHSHEGDLAFSRKQQQFGCAKQQTLPEDCTGCTFLDLCWGGCPKHRFAESRNGKGGLNYLCSGLKMFYRQVKQDLPRIRKALQLPKAV